MLNGLFTSAEGENGMIGASTVFSSNITSRTRFQLLGFPFLDAGVEYIGDFCRHMFPGTESRKECFVVLEKCTRINRSTLLVDNNWTYNGEKVRTEMLICR